MKSEKLGGLVLTIKSGDAVKIGDDITVYIRKISGDQTKVTVKAPKSIKVERKQRNAAGFFEDEGNEG